MAKASATVLILIAAMAASMSHAFADTVDAAVQPYLVGGGFLAGVFFAALGVFYIHRGFCTRRLARDSAHWPATDGNILAATVTTEIRQGFRSGRFSVFIPKTRYVYVVGSNHYEGNVIRAGIDQFGYGVEAQAKAQLDPYKVGATMPVRYDPANPSVAVLEAAEYGGARNIFGGVIFALVGAGAFVFAIWASTLTTH